MTGLEEGMEQECSTTQNVLTAVGKAGTRFVWGGGGVTGQRETIPGKESE